MILWYFFLCIDLMFMFMIGNLSSKNNSIFNAWNKTFSQDKYVLPRFKIVFQNIFRGLRDFRWFNEYKSTNLR